MVGVVDRLTSRRPEGPVNLDRYITEVIRRRKSEIDSWMGKSDEEMGIYVQMQGVKEILMALGWWGGKTDDIRMTGDGRLVEEKRLKKNNLRIVSRIFSVAAQIGELRREIDREGEKEDVFAKRREEIVRESAERVFPVKIRKGNR